MESPQESVSFDDVLDALGHIQRRKLLVALLDHNPQDESPAVIADEDTEALDNLISMKHVHLPKLEMYGFIDWDQEHNEVNKGPNFHEIKPLLELVQGHEDELPADWV
jgi:hypothetical protein